MAAGRFRQDLYYRLSAFSVELPPLRSCPEDVCFLIDRLMEKIPQKYGVPSRSLSGEAFGKLLAYNWPGNIRELENVLENAVALSESELIYAEHIHLEGTAPAPLTLKERLKREERRILRQTLAQCGGSRVKAMELLGLSKTVFYGKLKEYQLDKHVLFLGKGFGNRNSLFHQVRVCWILLSCLRILSEFDGHILLEPLNFAPLGRLACSLHRQ